jgi:hypothetical protein
MLLLRARALCTCKLEASTQVEVERRRFSTNRDYTRDRARDGGPPSASKLVPPSCLQMGGAP